MPPGLARPHLLNEGIIGRERVLIKGMLVTSQRIRQPRMDPAHTMSKGKSALKPSNQRAGIKLGKPETGLSCMKPMIPHPGTPATLFVLIASFTQ